LNQRDRKLDTERQRWQKYQQTMGHRGRKAKIGTRSQTERDGEEKRHGLQGREREDLKDGDRKPVRQRWRKKVHGKKKITAASEKRGPEEGSRHSIDATGPWGPGTHCSFRFR